MLYVRTVQNLSITLPADMLDRAKKLASQENRTMSELMREAFREYERKRRWDELNAYGRARAVETGVTEESIPQLVKQWRKARAKA